MVAALTPEDEGKLIIGFRPENVAVSLSAAPGAIPVEISIVEELGSDAYAYGTIVGDDPKASAMQGGQVIARVDPREVPGKGQTVYIMVRPQDQHIFSSATGERLGD